MKVGILALQGNFSEHAAMLDRCGAESIEVRSVEDLNMIDGLIIPGGESTTVSKLMRSHGIDDAIKLRASHGMPVFGTCMGLVVISKRIEDDAQKPLGLMDVDVRRNAFGRQVDSFECELIVSRLGKKPVRAVFIRAPFISRVHNGVEILAKIGERIVLAKQKNILGSAFHPELTDDIRVHRLFLDMVTGRNKL